MRGDRITRRQAIALLSAGAGISLIPRPLQAQPPGDARRIGVLMARKITDPEGQKQFAALEAALAELGWTQGRSLHIEIRWTEGDPDKALKYAPELVALKPDVLIANGTPSLGALRKSTTTIPIVFVGVADPVNQGFVPSLARPGGNITGFSVEEPSMGGKWLELLTEVAPRVKRVTVIYNPDTAPYAPMFMPTLQAAAPPRGVSLTVLAVRNTAEIERAIAGAGSEPNDGLIVLPDSFLFGQRATIIAATVQQRLPAIYPIQFFASDGGLIAYGIDRVDLFRRAGSYVDRILKGASPAELPVQQPTKFELAVNVKTANLAQQHVDQHQIEWRLPRRQRLAEGLTGAQPAG